LGPITIGSTESLLEAFKLAHSIEQLKQWLVQEYWPQIVARYTADSDTAETRGKSDDNVGFDATK